MWDSMKQVSVGCFRRSSPGSRRKKAFRPRRCKPSSSGLGEVGVPDYEIPARLDAAAGQLIELRAQLARLGNDRPELAAIRQQALALIDRGDVDRARAVLNGGREAAPALGEEASCNEPELLADETNIDHLQLAYCSAAARYAEAAVLVGPFDCNGEWEFLMRQASELADRGASLATTERSSRLPPSSSAQLPFVFAHDFTTRMGCDTKLSRQRARDA